MTDSKQFLDEMVKTCSKMEESDPLRLANCILKDKDLACSNHITIRGLEDKEKMEKMVNQYSETVLNTINEVVSHSSFGDYDKYALRKAIEAHKSLCNDILNNNLPFDLKDNKQYSFRTGVVISNDVPEDGGLCLGFYAVVFDMKKDTVKNILDFTFELQPKPHAIDSNEDDEEDDD